MMDKPTSNFSLMVKPGTPQCAVACGFLGAAIAALLLAIGFWKTLFIVLFGAVGVLIGGIGNKKKALQDAVNRRFPGKDEPLTDFKTGKSEIDEITERLEQTRQKNEQEQKEATGEE